MFKDDGSRDAQHANGDEEPRSDKAPRWRPRRASPWLAALALVVVSLVGVGFVWSRPVAPATSPAPATTTGSARPSSASEPTTPPVGDTTIIATNGGGGVVSVATAFRLTSGIATPAAELAKRVTVTPSIDLSVTPESDRSVLLQPKAPLIGGVVYRFDLASPAGVPLDSWAFQASTALHVVTTLPGDRTTQVPINTGIEVAFDQDGVAGAAKHFRIRPALAGRFEQHGRVLVFVPSRALARKTLYTVTVTKGVTVAGTDQTLEADVTFKFETAAKEGASRNILWLSQTLYEATTSDRPILGVASVNGMKRSWVEVYRLPDLDAAIAAYRRMASREPWAQWADNAPVSTRVLRRILAARLPVMKLANHATAIRLPSRLPPGWYLVQTGRSDHIQAVLQVTDVSAYLAVSDTRLLVWVNDVRTGHPVVNAKAAVAGSGAGFGVTAPDGLLVADTRAALQQPATRLTTADGGARDAPIVVVRAPDGRAVFIPTYRSAKWSPCGDDSYMYSDFGGDEGTDRFWNVLDTDRTLYRRTDVLNIWGLVRDRATGSVPSAADLRLVPDEGWYGDDAPAPIPIAQAAVQPNADGVFAASLKLSAAPEGYYRVVLGVADQTITSRYIRIGTIQKPAYRLTVTTGHRAYVVGDLIRTTVEAEFYEGTQVAHVPLHVTDPNAVERTVSTDATGIATFRTEARPDQYGDLWREVAASPARAEEGLMTDASARFVVFPSSRTVDVAAEITGGRLRVTGSVHLVDIERVERELQTSDELGDVNGSPVSGASVSVDVREIIPTRRQIGSAYDFIEKKVTPIYEYDFTYRSVGTLRVASSSDGKFAVTIPTGGSKHDFEATVRVSDREGRVALASANAMVPGRDEPGYQREPTLADTATGSTWELTYGLGDVVDVTMRSESGKAASGGSNRYLFFDSQLGIRAAHVQAGPRFRATFDAAWVPNTVVTGVRFTGSGYESSSYEAYFRASDRELTVRLSPGASRYEPGGHATVGVQTVDRTGHPVTATVVLRVVDEKLFSIAAAEAADPLSSLYAWISSGRASWYASHAGPTQWQGCDSTGGGEGGDTEGRSDFRDSLLFKVIRTDPSGHGSVGFDLSDDLTSWRVSASAFTASMSVGEATVKVPVGLPLFVDASIAPEYLAADRPVIHVRVNGSGLSVGDRVSITVESRSLPLRARTITAKAFDDVRIALPALTVGDHEVAIAATSTQGGVRLTDRLIRTFHVTSSRLTRSTSRHVALTDGLIPPGGSDLTTLVFTDLGRASYLRMLTELLDERGPRLDRLVAAGAARDLLARYDPGAAGSLTPVEELVASRYQLSDALTLMPYSSGDLSLSTLVALTAPDAVDRTALGSYFRSVMSDRKATRERQIYALVGLAGLHDPVLPALRAAAANGRLTVRERLMVGLGAAALGDLATARAIHQRLGAAHAEGLGDTSRLDVGSKPADVTLATAYFAVLAAAVGDGAAPAFWGYVDANPSADDPLVLQKLAFASAMLQRSPGEQASFAYTVAGRRTVVELDRGQVFHLAVGPTQRRELTLEPLTGRVGVASTWSVPARVSDFRLDRYVTITRSVRPSPARASDLVRVDLVVRFAAGAPRGTYAVTDFTPSGLMAVSNVATEYERGVDYAMPYDQAPGRVSFCVEKGKSPTVTLRYYARVITSGTYRWEPAIAQLSPASSRAALTSASSITIG